MVSSLQAEKVNEMEDVIKTREMELGPVRVPVMMQKNLAAHLAAYLLKHDRSHYDATLEKIINLGIEATKSQHRRS